MLERIRHLNRKILLLLGTALFIAVAGSNVRNVNADEHREGDVVYLDSEIREVSDDTVNEWALDAGLIEKAVDSEKICTRMDLDTELQTGEQGRSYDDEIGGCQGGG